MNVDAIYCYVCDKVIPVGTTCLSISTQRERFMPDDVCCAVEEECPTVVFFCCEDCKPFSVEVPLHTLFEEQP